MAAQAFPATGVSSAGMWIVAQIFGLCVAINGHLPKDKGLGSF